jgi:hypothetical protein
LISQQLPLSSQASLFANHLTSKLIQGNELSNQNKETVENGMFSGYAFTVFDRTSINSQPNRMPIGAKYAQGKSGSHRLGNLQHEAADKSKTTI